MKALAGTWQLFKIYSRLDRVKLPMWIITNVGIIALTLPQLISAYSSEEKRMIYAATTSPSVVTRLLGGALTGPSIGEITIVETFVLAALLAVLMNIFLIGRHTRQNEESGRSELMGSMIVGRQASLTAALLLALLANIVTTLLVFLVYIGNDFSLAGSLAYSIGLGLVGMVFAGVAAVTSQLFESTRGANGMAGLVFGLAFMARGIGDALGTLLPGSTGVQTSWISWLSPLGWATNMRPFAAEPSEQWWVFSMFGLLTVILLVAAYFLLAHRDIGSAIFAPRSGRTNATSSLLRRFGLVWRLNRVSFFSWLTALMVMGAALGGVANEFGKLIESNEEMQKVLAAIGGGQDVSKIMFGATFTITGIAVAGYSLSVLTRMRSEETSGRLEVVLSTAESRYSWLGTYTLFTLAAAFIVLLLAGLVAGFVYGLTVGNLLSNMLELGGSILVHLPAVAVLVSAGLVLYSLAPRRFTLLTWSMLGACLLIFQLGAILDLPQFIMNLSPFTHTPPAPAASIDSRPLLVQSAVAVLFTMTGFALFKRRDLETE